MHMISVEQVKIINPELMQAVQGLFPQLTNFSPMPDEADLLEIINSPVSSLWIAKNDGEQIIGMLCLVIYRTPSGVHARIEDVVVDQKARRQGAAAQMTTTAIEYASQSGAKAINLTSRPERGAANQLYQSLGFELVSTNVYRKKLT